jgi:hypothetical protein
VAQDRDRWRDVVKAVMNLRVLAPLNWLFLVPKTSLRRNILSGNGKELRPTVHNK